ncbi:hypothetical protein HDU67_007830 [Dinochytrium kinnereticum]|nr:hypothetical protein HDU67_007830 [Dinochytrium kinnereticum]
MSTKILSVGAYNEDDLAVQGIFVIMIPSVGVPPSLWLRDSVKLTSALSVAATYKGTGIDAANIANVGMDCLGVAPSNVTLLTQDPRQQADGTATREEILSNLNEMAENAQPGDHLVFFFSGHGGQTSERVAGSESDGNDEFIMAEDGQIITDNEFGAILEQLPEGCRFTLLSDSCNSGTLADLESLNIQADVVSITAAADGMTTQGGADGSAFTQSLTRVLSEDPSMSPADIRDAMIADGFGQVQVNCNVDETSPAFPPCADDMPQAASIDQGVVDAEDPHFDRQVNPEEDVDVLGTEFEDLHVFATGDGQMWAGNGEVADSRFDSGFFPSEDGPDFGNDRNQSDDQFFGDSLCIEDGMCAPQMDSNFDVATCF